MQTKNYLNCSEAAKVMGVSRSTVKRYCESGELRSHKTVGGHRRIESSDVSDWIAGKKTRRRRRVPLHIPGGRFRPEMVAQALLTGNLQKLDLLIDNVIIGKQQVSWLVDHFLAPAMWEIGSRWANEKITYVEERRATSNLKLLFRNLANSIRPNHQASRAVGGTLEGDQAEIGSMAVELVACEAEWEAFHVGSNLPVETLAQIALQMEAKCLWVSFCHVEDQQRTIEQSHLLRTMLPSETVIAIGGYALTPALLEELEYDFHGKSCSEMSEFLNELNETPIEA